ncbi:phosphopantetheine-binding protein [Sphaerisporangium dianthi]|uniref:Phosphopantetheine-binding protein n=1 Tax=Sphaerisporangium dianthi TaxID=1436120 RepID=A0ABV9CF99_9ACTN
MTDPDVTRAPIDTAELRRRVADMVAVASDGEVDAEEVLQAGVSFTALGVTSLTTLRLIDAVEEEFGVEIDLGGDVGYLDDLDSLVRHILAASPARR